MVAGSLTKYLLYGLIAAFAITSLADPQRAYASTRAFGGVGSALGSLGTGLQSLFTGVGTGFSQLFNPLWTLKDLIFSPQAGVQTPTDIREIASTQTIPQTPQQQQYEAIETSPLPYPQQQRPTNPIFAFQYDPRIDPAQAVAPSRVHGQTVPLSQAAISYYQSIGVQVSPESNQTIQSRNPANATSATHQASNGITSAVGSKSVATRGGSPAAAAAAASLRAAARRQRA